MTPSTAPTPQQALEVLDRATQPQAQGRLTREDYTNCQIALEVLRSALANGEKPGQEDQA
jgi:hypothetical protein